MQGNSRKSGPREVYDELLHSLEQARTRLAVAIATESKATPLERIRYYRETDEKVHRCVRELRSLRRSGVEGQQGWQEALSALKRLLAPEYDGDDYTKDIDFTPDGVAARRAAGYADAREMLGRRPWLAPVDPMEGVIIHQNAPMTERLAKS